VKLPLPLDLTQSTCASALHAAGLGGLAELAAWEHFWMRSSLCLQEVQKSFVSGRARFGPAQRACRVCVLVRFVIAISARIGMSAVVGPAVTTAISGP